METEIAAIRQYRREIMRTFLSSVSAVFRGALRAFRSFPASSGCALAFAAVTAVQIQMDWSVREPYEFVSDCLLWAFALGVLFSIMAVTAAQSRFRTPQAFLLANLLGVASAAFTYLGLDLFGGVEQAGSTYRVISDLAAARVAAAMLVCLIVFVLLAADPKDRFAESLFMVHKAFFIALLYGLVLLLGTMGVARVVQSLLYHDMSYKVYSYLGTLVGLLTYTIFLGYFPDFGGGDVSRDAAQKQPRFIQVLFGSILVPVVLALTVVLLLWAGKTIFSGMQVSFVRLSSIAAAYTIGGLWLHVMISGQESAPARLYRKVYPIASAVILLFEAWAVIRQLKTTGLKTEEYLFLLIWVLAAVGSVLLLFKMTGAHRLLAVLACALTVFAVLPVVGYQAMPVRAQTKRLEALLTGEKILKNNQLTPATLQPDQQVRANITDAVDFLANVQDAKLPAWFDPDLSMGDTFREKLGFDKTWISSDGEETTNPDPYRGTYLSLSPAVVNLSNYRWEVNLQSASGKGGDSASFTGDRGTYQVDWSTAEDGVPTLRITRDGTVLLKQDLTSYLDGIREKYPPQQSGNAEAPLGDMSLTLETADLRVFLIFSNVSISVDSSGATSYWVSLKDFYLSETP